MQDEKKIINEVDCLQIMNLLPHRYPFLLVDKVNDIIPNESAVGLKNVTMNEQVFQGHFPNDPIFPGVLTVEAMAQTSAVLALLSVDYENGDKKMTSIYFMTIDGVKFRKPVRPGDTLIMKVMKEHSRGNVWQFKAEAFVKESLVTQANFMAMLKQD